MNRTNRPRPSIVAAVIVAGLTTYNAYLAMVAFGIDNLGMDPATAYITAGVFELSLVTVAMLAREATRDNRPTGVLLTLTWVMSGASGVFAAIHEHDLGNGFGAMAFRAIVPTLAALMWHLSLIGDRHLATGTTWGDARRQRYVQTYYEAGEALLRADELGKGIKRAQRRLIRARHRARKVSTPALMIANLDAFQASSAAETATMLAARDNHIRQSFAFQNTTNQETNQTTDQQPTAPNPIATIPAPAPVAAPRPAPKPVAPVTAPVFAQTATPATRTTNHGESGSGRHCVVCGDELPAGSTAKYCTKNPDGSRNQKCKNRYYSPKFKAVRDRVNLEKAVDRYSTSTVAFA